MFAPDSTRKFVVLGNPDNRRVASFQAALAGLGFKPAEVVAYRDFLAGGVDLRRVLSVGSALRIESPGEDFEVEKALLALGADQPDAGPEISRLTAQQASRLAFDKGRIRYCAQWFLGFNAALGKIKEQLAEVGPAETMNHPDDIVTMFDKRACHEALTALGLPLAPALPPVHSFEELCERMTEQGWSRVFIKPLYGSSASGVVAFARHGHKLVAYTSVELVRSGDETRLYNSLRLRRYEDHREIRSLVDTLCRERVHVERWLPKASLQGHSFDLRVVVIGGQARHSVVRMSSSPVTNLHLGNKRGTLRVLQERLGGSAWTEAMKTCERVMEALPGSHYAGIDLAIEAGFRRHAVLEVNAFGDLLPNILSDGLDTYATEVACFCNRGAVVQA